MLVMIYFCKWDGSVSSHDLLRRAVKEYLLSGETAALRSASNPTIDPELDPEMNPRINPIIASIQDWRIVERDGGKPYFPDHPGILFSVSHSGDYWVCAIAPEEVGLDLQEENQTKRAEKLAKRFFHPHEQAYLKSVDYRDFTRIWAAKESYLKYTGEGIAGGISHFSVVDPVTIDAVQTEISFDKDYKMVLTTANSVEYRTEVLQK